jgi:hypothetical protein
VPLPESKILSIVILPFSSKFNQAMIPSGEILEGAARKSEKRPVFLEEMISWNSFLP